MKLQRDKLTQQIETRQFMFNALLFCLWVCTEKLCMFYFTMQHFSHGTMCSRLSWTALRLTFGCIFNIMTDWLIDCSVDVSFSPEATEHYTNSDLIYLSTHTHMHRPHTSTCIILVFHSLLPKHCIDFGSCGWSLQLLSVQHLWFKLFKCLQRKQMRHMVTWLILQHHAHRIPSAISILSEAYTNIMTIVWVLI